MALPVLAHAGWLHIAARTRARAACSLRAFTFDFSRYIIGEFISRYIYYEYIYNVYLCSTEKIASKSAQSLPRCLRCTGHGWLVMANTYAAAAVVVRSSSLSR